MAQKRMIDKKISVSEQVANLSISAQCLYTWSIPHADDLGLLHVSARTLKATIVPMWEMPLADFEKLVEEICQQKLWTIFEHDRGQYYRLANFTRYQTLKRDRQPQTILPIMYLTDPKETWAFLETIGFQLETSGIQVEAEVKRSEEKGSEVKREKAPHASVSYLSKIPAEDMAGFVKRFIATEKEIKSKAEDLLLYCQSKRKVYANYRSFLLNALKKDFKERDGAGASKYAKL